MTQNPYGAPQSNVERLDTAPGSPVKAIFWGSVVSIGGAMIAGALVAVAAGVYWTTQGFDAEWISHALVASTPIAAINLLIGLGFGLWGGWMTSAIARHREYRYSLIMAAILYVLGEIMMALQPDTRAALPLWYLVLGYLLTLPSVLAGTYLERRRRHRRVPRG